MSDQAEGGNTIRIVVDPSATNPSASKIELQYLIEKLDGLSRRVEHIESNRRLSSSLLRKLEHLTSLSFWMLILFPLIIMASVIAVLSITTPDSTIIKFAHWWLGFVGLGTIIQIIYTLSKVSDLEKRVTSHLEEKH